jgi:hypothetical protein
METEFWIKAWNEGRTNFHQESYNPKLVKYFPIFKAKAQEKVLVPLCGKTKDLLWLQSINLEVHGYELHQQAIEDFLKRIICINQTNFKTIILLDTQKKIYQLAMVIFLIFKKVMNTTIFTIEQL